MRSWFPFTIGELLWSCIIKLPTRFTIIKLHDDGFDLFSNVLICEGLPNSMDLTSTFILEREIHFFLAFFYPLQDIVNSFIIATFSSMNPQATASAILFISSHLIMGWLIVFALIAIFPSNSLIFQFVHRFFSDLEMVSSFNF